MINFINENVVLTSFVTGVVSTLVMIYLESHPNYMDSHTKNVKRLFMMIFDFLTKPIGGPYVSDMECKCGSCKLKRERLK